VPRLTLTHNPTGAASFSCQPYLIGNRLHTAGDNNAYQVSTTIRKLEITQLFVLVALCIGQCEEEMANRKHVAGQNIRATLQTCYTECELILVHGQTPVVESTVKTGPPQFYISITFTLCFIIQC
jgi:hypothetical protein